MIHSDTVKFLQTFNNRMSVYATVGRYIVFKVKNKLQNRTSQLCKNFLKRKYVFMCMQLYMPKNFLEL